MRHRNRTLKPAALALAVLFPLLAGFTGRLCAQQADVAREQQAEAFAELLEKNPELLQAAVMDSPAMQKMIDERINEQMMPPGNVKNWSGQTTMQFPGGQECGQQLDKCTQALGQKNLYIQALERRVAELEAQLAGRKANNEGSGE